MRGGILHLIDDSGKDRTVVGTVACVPAAFGAACASVVLRALS
jgi:hypothetical protein